MLVVMLNAEAVCNLEFMFHDWIVKECLTTKVKLEIQVLITIQ